MFALFNTNLNFIGYSPDIQDQPHILKKEIPEHQRDLNVWKWEGNYTDGKMVSIFEEGIPQEELEEQKRMFNDLNSKYPTGVQLVNIIRQLKKIAEQSELQDDRFMDMAENVLNVMDKHDKHLKYVLTRKKFFN